jgi:hypothetical protein
MARLFPGLIRVAVWGGVVTASLLAGCGPKDGLSDNDRRMLAIQSGADALKSQGAKVEERNYSLGNSWAVSLSGMTITDELLKQVKQLGNISELNLSKSTLTDAQLATIQELGLGTLLVKFDLSHTAVTDEGFEKLDNLRLLSQLNLTGTKVTPAAVERFKKNRQNDPRILALFKNPKIQN